MLLETAGWRVFWGLTSGRQCKLRALQKGQLQHVPTLDSRTALTVSWCFASYTDTDILIRRDWKGKWRTRGRVCARHLLFRSKEVRWGELFFPHSLINAQRPVLAKTCKDTVCNFWTVSQDVLLQCSYIMCQLPLHDHPKQFRTVGRCWSRKSETALGTDKPWSGAVESRNSRQSFAQARCNKRSFHWRWYEFDFCLTTLIGPLRSRDDRVFFHHFDPRTPTLAAARPPWGHSKNRSNSITGIILCIVFLFAI